MINQPVKPNTCIKFEWINDDVCEVSLDDEHIGDVTFDLYGRAGMAEVLNTLKKIILIKGWSVKVEGDVGV